MMNYSGGILTILLLIFSLLISSCDLLSTKFTQEEIYKKNDIWYEKKSNEPLTGLLEVKDNNGFVKSKIPFKNGLIHGLAKEYHEQSDAIATEVRYENGQKHGTVKVYSPSGYMIGEETYQNGKRHGESKAYLKSGKLESRSIFENGQYVLLEMYDPSGSILHRIEFENGKKSHEYFYRKGD